AVRVAAPVRGWWRTRGLFIEGEEELREVRNLRAGEVGCLPVAIAGVPAGEDIDDGLRAPVVEVGRRGPDPLQGRRVDPGERSSQPLSAGRSERAHVVKD